MQKQPPIERCHEKKNVGKSRMLRPQRTKKSIDKAETHAGEERVKEPLGGKLRSSHRIKRLNQPPAGRGSS